jgi:quercetin dioxygenase-like cupin family protein
MTSQIADKPRVRPKVSPIRRIITGHDEKGRAVIVADEVCPHVDSILGLENFATTELWTTAVPADNAVSGDPVKLPHRIAPPDNGAVLRIVEFPPDKTFRDALRPDQVLAVEGSGKSGGSQLLHRTRSVDFAIIISGEIWCVMDEGEVLMHPGDVLIQRGTNHDWQNRTQEPAQVAFVLIDAQPLKGGLT